MTFYLKSIIIIVILAIAENFFNNIKAQTGTEINSRIDYANYFVKIKPQYTLQVADSVLKCEGLNDTLLAKAYFAKGNALFHLNLYDSAVEFWHLAMDIYEEKNNLYNVAVCKECIGEVYELNGDFTRANENYQSSLRVYEKLNKQNRVANALNNIGKLNYNLNNIDIAEQYFKQALQKYEELVQKDSISSNLQIGIGNSYNNLGLILSNQLKYTESIIYFKKALFHFNKVQDTFYMAYISHNLGVIYSEIKDYSESKAYFEMAIQYNRNFQNHILYPTTLGALGNLMQTQNKSLDAISYYLESQQLALKYNFTRIIENNYLGLYECYKSLGDYKNALINHELYSQVKDSVMNESKYKLIMDIQTRYETEKKERQISEQKNQIQLQRTIIIGISIVFVIIGSLILLIIRFYQSRKVYHLHHEMNLLGQKALISQINPHFIFNALNSIQSFIIKNDKLSSNIFLSNFADLMRKVLENSQHQMVSIQQEIEALQTYLTLEKLRFEDKFEYHVEIFDELNTNELKIPTMIIQPFVENAIWHGFSGIDYKGIVVIRISNIENTLQILIEDNGIGIKKAQEIKTTARKSYGTEIVEKRIQLLNQLKKYKIAIKYSELKENAPNPGTRIEILLPIIYE